MEGNLDVQYLMAIAPLSPTTFWHVKQGVLFSSWLFDVAYTIKPPLVHSISWGMDEIYASPGEFNGFEVAAMRLGLMGVTLVAASGDQGAHGNSANPATQCEYIPLYPATSRYVLSVGGTMVRLEFNQSNKFDIYEIIIDIYINF